MALKEPVKSVGRVREINSRVTLDHSSVLNYTESLETQQGKGFVFKVEEIRGRNN